MASNGDVVPCCIVADSDTVRMGNVFEQPFGEIWNGPAYRRLREQIRSHQLPSFCHNCYGETPPAPGDQGCQPSDPSS